MTASTWSALAPSRQAKAVLEEANKNRDRVKSLSESGIASQAELDTVEAAYKVAVSRATIRRWKKRGGGWRRWRSGGPSTNWQRKQLADASVRAPFDGAIQARPPMLANTSRRARRSWSWSRPTLCGCGWKCPNARCTLVRTGQVVHLFVEGDTNAYTGRIARLSPALDEQIRMLLVEADVPSRGSLRPGLFARANIIIDERQESLSVPADALITFAGIEKVVVVQEGKAVEKVVVTGRRGPDWAEIISGISAGEQIILNPGGLRTGQPVSDYRLAMRRSCQRPWQQSQRPTECKSSLKSASADRSSPR